jgi:hypothetical protein
MIRPVNAPSLNRDTQDWSGGALGFTPMEWIATDNAPMFAARFPAPYNLSFTNGYGKPAIINREITL